MNHFSAKLGLSFAIVSLLSAVECLAADQPPFRAARSVHLGYSAPDGLVFYNEMIVDASVNGSYFMACGWNTGYFGIQQLDGPDDKVVLFSVWDPSKGDDPNAVKKEDRVEVLYQAQDVRIKRFGGEGTGGQCLWRYNWHISETNRFIVAAQIEDQKTSYTAWFRASGDWKKLAAFRTRTAGKPLSGYYSFIEDFRRDGKSVDEVRRARFCNGWIKTVMMKWEPLVQARFTASAAEWESKENIDARIDAGFFCLATGGNTRMHVPLRSVHDLTSVPMTTRDGPVSLPSEISGQ